MDRVAVAAELPAAVLVAEPGQGSALFDRVVRQAMMEAGGWPTAGESLVTVLRRWQSRRGDGWGDPLPLAEYAQAIGVSYARMRQVVSGARRLTLQELIQFVAAYPAALPEVTAALASAASAYQTGGNHDDADGIPA